MVRTSFAALAGLSLFLAPVAHAQFANRSLGLSVGYMSISDPHIPSAVPLSLESSLYIENGFDLTLRVPLMILRDTSVDRDVVGAGANLGVRYLLSEEWLRPYLGAELAFLHVFRDPESGAGVSENSFGVGPQLGVDYFVSESVSLGARGFVTLYVMLNREPKTSLGGQAVVATYF